MKRTFLLVMLVTLLLPLGVTFAQDTPPEAPATVTDTVGVNATKAYLVTGGAEMLTHVTQIQADAQAYFDIMKAADFDYQKAWDASTDEIKALVSDARSEFILAHNNYEHIEGIVAGVPTLADFDVWIDAGPTGADDPENARDWTLTLDDGRSFEKPGNIFHWLLETTLWGTQADHTGLRVDFDGNGTDERGDALPDAHFWLAIANAFVEATTDLNTAIAAWEPSLEDSFTALVTMIPTMGDYFQEWKNSAFVAGQDPRFVAQSRLVDVKGIASSLSVIYSNVDGDVTGEDATLNDQIDSGFSDLLRFLDETYAQEQDGKHFSAEQADALGEQAQTKADTLAALVGQAASLLNLTLPLQ
ncbi:MAG: EfeM/EfeO family lipoprotein [Chloroflexi bacterium]|nr:EfeM/EfeO family lipoprotein [Chloroflexota bacterium]